MINSNFDQCDPRSHSDHVITNYTVLEKSSHVLLINLIDHDHGYLIFSHAKFFGNKLIITFSLYSLAIVIV